MDQGRLVFGAGFVAVLEPAHERTGKAPTRPKLTIVRTNYTYSELRIPMNLTVTSPETLRRELGAAPYFQLIRWVVARASFLCLVLNQRFRIREPPQSRQAAPVRRIRGPEFDNEIDFRLSRVAAQRDWPIVGFGGLESKEIRGVRSSQIRSTRCGTKSVQTPREKWHNILGKPPSE